MTGLSPRIAVYPGSFDPITLGHQNVIRRASRLFDRLIVGIGVNIEKRMMFDSEERMELIRGATAELQNIEFRTFDGLAVDFAKSCQASVMIRGVRPNSPVTTSSTFLSRPRS